MVDLVPTPPVGSVPGLELLESDLGVRAHSCSGSADGNSPKRSCPVAHNENAFIWMAFANPPALTWFTVRIGPISSSG